MVHRVGDVRLQQRLIQNNAITPLHCVFQPVPYSDVSL